MGPFTLYLNLEFAIWIFCGPTVPVPLCLERLLHLHLASQMRIEMTIFKCTTGVSLICFLSFNLRSCLETSPFQSTLNICQVLGLLEEQFWSTNSIGFAFDWQTSCLILLKTVNQHNDSMFRSDANVRKKLRKADTKDM